MAGEARASGNGTTEARFVRLIERFMDRSVVPFIGAGISLASTCPRGKPMADTSYMADRVCRSLQCRRDCRAQMRRGECSRPRSLAHCCDRFVWEETSRGSRYPYQALVYRILRIQDFTTICIVPAHRYLAFLAREGVIEEIITTNFDICTSRAFVDTFENQCLHSDKHLKEIASLHEYRNGAGFRSADGRPVLKVYYINGCSERLVSGSGQDRKYRREALARTILLTGSQLQDWRDRHWSRELLRDRLRTRCLVFSGFGSSEPQVKHTFTQVCEEFSSSSNRDGATTLDNRGPESPRESSDAWQQPNAPFVHAYENHLSFDQKQMLLSFLHSCGATLSEQDLYVHGNCLTGLDDSFWPGTAGGGRTLAADVLWKHVYMAVFWKLLRAQLRPGTTFWHMVDEACYGSHALMAELTDWLLPTPSLGNDSSMHIFGRLQAMLDLDGHSTLLSRWMWHVRYRREIWKDSSSWYCALADRPVLLPAFFLMLYLLYGRHTTGPSPQASCEYIKQRVNCADMLGTYFRYDELKAGPKMLITLAHPDCAFSSTEMLPSLSCLGNVGTIVQILVGHSVKAKSMRIRAMDKKGEEAIATRFIHVYSIPLSSLLRTNAGVSSTADLIQNVFARNLAHCDLLVDEDRPRIGRVARPLMEVHAV